MIVLDRFVATGTQLKVERPGKAAAITPCDYIDGPIVKLLDGSVLKLEAEAAAKAGTEAEQKAKSGQRIQEQPAEEETTP